MIDLIIEKLKEYKLIALAGLVIVLIGGTFSLLRANTVKEEASFPEIQALAKTVESDEIINETPTPVLDTIVVDIKGAVHKEGVYELADGQRVNDLVEMAGGFLPDADPKSVNLAQKLTDEAVIYVARQGENITVPTLSASETTPTGQPSKVRLNKATLADLQMITGIGAKRAQDILDYRDANGDFKSLEDLKNVSGIGDKTFEKIKEEITLD